MSTGKIPLDGGTPLTLAGGQSGPTEIAVDAVSVYWTNHDGGTIVKVPLTGGHPTTLATGQSSIRAIAVDATSVYWTTASTPDNSYQDGTVMKLTPK